MSNPRYTGDPPGQLYTTQATIQDGIAAQLDVELTVESSAGFDPTLNPGAATENFLNTLAWGGIQDVTLGGQQVGVYALVHFRHRLDARFRGTGNADRVAMIGVCLGLLRKCSGLRIR